MRCPECSNFMHPKAKKCDECGFKPGKKRGNSVDEDKNVNPEDSVLVWIGDQKTWVPRCEWKGRRRCCRAVTRERLCAWHFDCLDSAASQDDPIAFSEWCAVNSYFLGSYSVEEAFSAVTGTVDVHSEARHNFGQSQPSSGEDKFQNVLVNRAFLRGVSVWMSDGKDAGIKYMCDMAEKYPSFAAQFMIAGKDIERFKTYQNDDSLPEPEVKEPHAERKKLERKPDGSLPDGFYKKAEDKTAQDRF